MGISYDKFTEAFLDKITEFELLAIKENIRQEIVDGYMKRAITAFGRVCRYDLITTMNDDGREFDIEISGRDLGEIIDIVSDGMVVQWLKPYLYKQELLENVLNTRDFTSYSPAELLLRVGNAYKQASKDYTQKIREYSYDTGDLTDLHI